MNTILNPNHAEGDNLTGNVKKCNGEKDELGDRQEAAGLEEANKSSQSQTLDRSW